MYVSFAKTFIKSEKRIPQKIREAFYERLTLFTSDKGHPLLRMHPLSGEWKGYYSINVTADWRAIYYERDGSPTLWVEFVYIGTHSQLYE